MKLKEFPEVARLVLERPNVNMCIDDDIHCVCGDVGFDRCRDSLTPLFELEVGLNEEILTQLIAEEAGICIDDAEEVFKVIASSNVIEITNNNNKEK